MEAGMTTLKDLAAAAPILATTPGGMRILMMRNARDNALTKAVDTAAVMFRMTELDRYTTLAYYALLEAEELRARLINEISSRTPCFVISKCDLPADLKLKG
jgi:hypothetical protein